LYLLLEYPIKEMIITVAVFVLEFFMNFIIMTPV